MKTCLLSTSHAGKEYCIDELLGAGSGGKVYRGYALDAPDIAVAIKLPLLDLTPSDLALAYHNTMKEVGLLQKTSNPQVVQCLDYGADPSFPYVVMEYIPETLANISLTPQIIEDTIAQLPTIIAVLADAGVAHCDLREHNIGYQNRTLKLLDFGLAIPFEIPVSYNRRSAQPYLPQEFRRYKLVTKTTDIYSAGRVLEHLLTGEYSTSATRALARMKEIYRTEPPRSFQRLLREMLRHDHFLRPRPEKLRMLAQQALHDMQQNNPFSLDALIPLSEAGIDFGISSSS